MHACGLAAPLHVVLCPPSAAPTCVRPPSLFDVRCLTTDRCTVVPEGLLLLTSFTLIMEADMPALSRLVGLSPRRPGVRSQASPCRICGGWIVTVTSWSSKTSYFPWHCRSHPYSQRITFMSPTLLNDNILQRRWMKCLKIMLIHYGRGFAVGISPLKTWYRTFVSFY